MQHTTASASSSLEGTDNTKPTLYLASGSPRRAKLVELLGVKRIAIKPADVDESPIPSLSPEEFASHLALEKASATAKMLSANDSTGVVLGADTIVVIGDIVLGKPVDPADARRMLRMLSGATHTVITAVALLNPSSSEAIRFAEHTNVTFRELTDSEIAAYIASGSPMDKAGSYGIQEDHGAVFVSRIEGDYYNVVGLPLCSTYTHLIRSAPQLFA